MQRLCRFHGILVGLRAVAPLLALKAALDNGDSVSALSTWKQGGNPCDGWEGVTCGPGGNIVEL